MPAALFDGTDPPEGAGTQQRGSEGPIPGRSRQGDPLESDLAAASINPATTRNVKAAICEVLAVSPGSTDEQLIYSIRVLCPHVTATDQRIRTCRNELAHGNQPLVVQAGVGLSKTGRKARTWRLAGDS